ncbi:hypothetical protein BGX26_001836 [Mortierella sp. AD094]|nr:hypothetical protein BGX26_001836 [Mortierella sp. AD094]
MTESLIEFRAIFDSEKQSIEREMLELTAVPLTEIQAAIDNLFRRVYALQDFVTKTFIFLLPFDARIYLETVKAISERLSGLRRKLIPKPKFSFKSRKVLGPITPSSRPLKKLSQNVTFTSANQSLHMKFENRTGEHLFIEMLQPSASIEVEVENIYLGGVPVDISSLQYQGGNRDVVLTNLTECTVNLSRMYNSANMDIYLHVTNEPTIEGCTDMRFAPYPYQGIFPVNPDRLVRLFSSAHLNPHVNQYNHVKDSNWLRQRNSPNWRLLDPVTEVRSGIAQTIIAKDYVGIGGFAAL